MKDSTKAIRFLQTLAIPEGPLAGRRLREMATRLKVSVGIVHHTRKMAPGQDATMDDARGGGALRGMKSGASG